MKKFPTFWISVPSILGLFLDTREEFPSHKKCVMDIVLILLLYNDDHYLFDKNINAGLFKIVLVFFSYLLLCLSSIVNIILSLFILLFEISF